MPMVIYSLAYPAARAGDAMIRDFRDWIVAEIAQDGTGPLRMSVAE